MPRKQTSKSRSVRCQQIIQAFDYFQSEFVIVFLFKGERFNKLNNLSFEEKKVDLNLNLKKIGTVALDVGMRQEYSYPVSIEKPYGAI